MKSSPKYSFVRPDDDYGHKDDLDNPKSGGVRCYISSLVKIFILLLIVIPVILFSNKYFNGKEDFKELNFTQQNVQIHNFRPSADEQYVCTSHVFEEGETLYVTEFNTIDPNKAAHHMLLFGCEQPSKKHGEIWSCGEMSSNSAAQSLPSAPICGPGPMTIVFAEAMQAGAYHLPKNVSFKFGASSRIKALTLQIHYASVEKFKNDKNLLDSSGFSLKTYKEPTKYLAHVELFAKGYGVISKNTSTNLDGICSIKMSSADRMFPFAFRTHAHSYGQIVSGYSIDRADKHNWTLLARKSPQLMQTFYPVINKMSFRNDDRIAFRCFYENPTSHDVFIGGTRKDEMCNLYLMYYTESGQQIQTWCTRDWAPLQSNVKVKALTANSTKLDASETSQIAAHKATNHRHK